MATSKPSSGPDQPIRPLTGADSFWLRMDSPVNLMMIHGVMLFDSEVDFERLKGVMADRLLSIERFRSRVVVPEGRGKAHWELDPDFDLNRHITRGRLDPPGDDDALRELISRQMSVPPDPAHPPWNFQLVEGYKGGSALVGHLHHCLGDGIAMMLVLLSLTDLEPDGRGDENPFGALFHESRISLEDARTRTAEVMPEGMNLMIKPAEAWKRVKPVVKGAASSVALGKLAFRLNDKKTLFTGDLGVTKRVAWSRGIPLADVRSLSKSLGATINDVLTAAVGGGLRRYMLERHHPAGARDFRATVPVNIRPLDNMAALGNEFGLVYLKIPVSIDDPVERVYEVQRRMSKLKRSAEPVVSYRTLSLMGRLGPRLQSGLVRMFAAKATAVMTNVPGPRETLYMAGAPIRTFFFWVPQSAKISMGISILSYAGEVRLGIATDAGLASDPQRIVVGFEDELAILRRRADQI